MKRLLLLSLTLAASIGTGAAQNVSPPSADLATNACQSLVLDTLIGTASDHPDETANSTMLCNAHPRRQECLEAQRFLAQHAKAIPGLTCNASGNTPAANAAPGPSIPLAGRITESACALVGIDAVAPEGSPKMEGDMQVIVALCHENRSSCLEIKTFIESVKGKGNSGGLTCN